MKNTIIIKKENNNYYLTYKNLKSICYIGKNGITNNKKEGDNKTPKGTFSIGIVFGTHKREDIEIDNSIYYIQINKYHHWIDDQNSKYYNQLINIKETNIELTSSEHLINYKKQYEYAIEIKTNSNNIKGKGSAIFIHCANKEYTNGCISLPKENMKKLLSMINIETKIKIEE